LQRTGHDFPVEVFATGDQATSFVILGSIIIPLAILTALCWFFWKHRHDE
jgi:energy-converting hydrogenase Eha subunit A